jgi:hypothetical protein
MEHFSEQVWADFVRQPRSSKSGEKVESHLASGCKNCATALELWKRVHTLASHEGAYLPPADAVRMVKLEFAARRMQERAEEPTTASLIFDSFSQPALAGVRSVAAAARQMVYEADGLTVDLRFDGPPQSNKVLLTGQVLDRRTPRLSTRDASVMLWTERGLSIVETRANEFGEFNLEFEAQDQLRLSVEIGSTLIRIPLASLKPKHDADGTSDGSHAGNQ